MLVVRVHPELLERASHAISEPPPQRVIDSVKFPPHHTELVDCTHRAISVVVLCREGSTRRLATAGALCQAR